MKNEAVQWPVSFGRRWQKGEFRAVFTSIPVFPVLFVCLGYYFGARLGFALTLQPQPVSVLWPPNAILFAAFLLTPPRWWWSLVLAAIPAHWLSQLQSGVPQTMILCWFISNCTEAFLGASTFRRLAGPQPNLASFANIRMFVFCGVFMAPLLSSFVDAGFVTLNGWSEVPYWSVWRTRFFSNALANLTLVTVIVTWRKAGLGLSPKQWAEGGILIAGLFSVGWFVFMHQTAGDDATAAFLYMPLPFLLWAAVRFGVVGTATSILLLVFISIWGTAHGHGPFSSGSAPENALSLQVFLIMISIPLLSLAAVIQERKQVEDRLRSSEQRYRAVIDTQTDLICRFLPDTTLTFVNDAHCRFFNCHRDELIGRRFIELLPEPVREQSLEHIASLVNDPRLQTVQHEMLVPGGKRWVQWVNHAIRSPAGQVVEFQAMGQDITDRKRAEEANEKLAHVSRLAIVGELTASIAHEINQPLGAILTNTQAAEVLLEANPANIEEIKKILADIRKDDERVSHVIRHMRALFRKRHLETEVLDMNKVASDVLDLTRGEARKRSIALNTQFTSGLPAVKADRIQLEQVTLNFVLNGMDAMADTPQEQRRLTITTSRHPSGGIELAVSDTGKGIARNDFPKLFESFFTTKKEGMGLGLFISRIIVEANGGQIRAENNSGHGATFRVVLPACDRV